MEQYYARICWNSKGWRFPSGDAAELENNTYAAKNRFGYEEWLFNFMWIFEGYHYAHLQPVGRSFKRMTGKTLDILLWAINPNHNHVQIGEIKNCQVLTESQTREAIDYYKENGWFKQMEEDVSHVGGNKEKLSGTGLFNIRFLHEEAIQYDDPLPVAKPTDKIAKLSRYTLVAASQPYEYEQWHGRTRQGSTTIPSPQEYTHTGSQGCTVDPYHPVLQAKLMELLQKQFGKDNVVRESGWVDITVSNGKRRMLIEIKTDAVAKRAIREALGQILEYAYFSSDLQGLAQTADAELFIVAPALANEEVSAYLNLLRNKFHIPVRYCSFLPGSKLPESFKQDQ